MSPSTQLKDDSRIDLQNQQGRLVQAIAKGLNQAGLSQQSTRPPAHDASQTQARGMQAYQHNAQGLAERALQAAYPVVAAVLGHEAFRALAHQHWHDAPPIKGDLAQWGGGLPKDISQGGLANHWQALPYLADLARLEWAVHQCQTALDADLDANSIALLAQADASELQMNLMPGTVVLPSAHACVSVWQAHQVGLDSEGLYALCPDLLEAGERLQQGISETALVWRQGYKVRARCIPRAEHLWLNAVLAGQTLEAALDAVHADAGEFDFSQWLTLSVQTGLLHQIKALSPASI